MADVEIKTDQLNPCLCGFNPDHYTIAYGRTPYIVWCPNCQKRNLQGVGGNGQNIIDHWNNDGAGKTVEELKSEERRVIQFFNNREHRGI